MKKLTIKQDWFMKESQKDQFKLKTWGDTKIRTTNKQMSGKTPSAPLSVPRTPGGMLATRLKQIEQDISRVEEGGAIPGGAISPI